MKHQKKGRKLGREKGVRKALIKSLLHNFIIHNKIKTTEAKAKEIRPVMEKIITVAKKGTIAARRQVFKKLANQKDVHKIFNDIAPKYKERKGGYTRVIKTAPRKTDAAKMAVIEFV